MVELGKAVVYSGDAPNILESVSKCDPDFSYFSTKSRGWNFCCQTWQGTWYLLQTFGEHCSKLHVVCGLPYTNHKLVASEEYFPFFSLCFGGFFVSVFNFLAIFSARMVELQVCGVTNKPLENKYFRQRNKCIFYIGFELF